MGTLTERLGPIMASHYRKKLRVIELKQIPTRKRRTVPSGLMSLRRHMVWDGENYSIQKLDPIPLYPGEVLDACPFDTPEGERYFVVARQLDVVMGILTEKEMFSLMDEQSLNHTCYLKELW